MRTPRCCRLALLALMTAGAHGAFVAHGQEPMRAEVDAAIEKFARIEAAAETPRPTSAAPLENTISEREINSYLALEGPAFLPEGIAVRVPRGVRRESLQSAAARRAVLLADA